MRTYLIPDYATATASANAEIIAFGNVYGLQSGTLICETHVVGGNETATLLVNDSIEEKTLKGARVNDCIIGNRVVGAAPLAVIEAELENYVVYPTVTSTGNVLYKGTLKVGRTESFVPVILSTPNVQFKA